MSWITTISHDYKLSVFVQFHKYCVVELNTQLLTFTKVSAPSLRACLLIIKIVFQKDKWLLHFDTTLRFVQIHSWLHVFAGCGVVVGTFSKPRRRPPRGRGRTCHCYVQITGGEKTSTLRHCSKYSRNIYRYYTKSDFKILYITLKKLNWVAHKLLRRYISRCLVL